MITIANKTFNSIGQLSFLALQIAFIFAENHTGLDFVQEDDYRGTLVDANNNINAVFYGAINLLPLEQTLFITPLEDIRQREVSARLERQMKEQCDAVHAEIERLQSEAAGIAVEYGRLVNRIEDLKVEHLLNHAASEIF